MEQNNKKNLEDGDGKELQPDGKRLPKMLALHSSAVLPVNIFQYWQKRGLLLEITKACGFTQIEESKPQKIVFEDKYPVFEDTFLIDCKQSKPPNIDVVIHNNNESTIKRFAIECKFTEAYPGNTDNKDKTKVAEKKGLKQKYLEDELIWQDLPNLHQFAKTICPADFDFHHLQPAQLVRHILGLNRAFSKTGFQLLYLWYDALGADGFRHRQEVETFESITKLDGINFHAMTYQELIVLLCNEHRQDHSEFIRYISERYL